MTDEARVESALHEVIDPCSAANGSNLDIVEMGLIDSIAVSDGRVAVDMRLTTPACDMVAYFDEEIRESVGSLSGVNTVKIRTDNGFEWTSDMMSEEAKRHRETVIKEYAARHHATPKDD